jgi:hypothetical protein
LDINQVPAIVLSNGIRIIVPRLEDTDRLPAQAMTRQRRKEVGVVEGGRVEK